MIKINIFQSMRGNVIICSDSEFNCTNDLQNTLYKLKEKYGDIIVYVILFRPDRTINKSFFIKLEDI